MHIQRVDSHSVFSVLDVPLWQSHQSSSSRSQTPKAPREAKRKANAGTDESGVKKTASGKSEKKTKSSGSSGNRRPATPPASQTTYIPLPNTVVATNRESNLAPFSSSNEHPYNRHRFKYVTCEPDPLLQYMLYRQTANPILPGVRLCREDMSPYMLIDEDCMTITTEKGFRMVRANCGVREGRWYYEVTIDRGGEPRYEGRDGAHVRLGWARREGKKTIFENHSGYLFSSRRLESNLPPLVNKQPLFKHPSASMHTATVFGTRLARGYTCQG